MNHVESSRVLKFERQDGAVDECGGKMQWPLEQSSSVVAEPSLPLGFVARRYNSLKLKLRRAYISRIVKF